MNPEHDQCESDVDDFPVGSPPPRVLEDPDCDACKKEFGYWKNCIDCPYRDHPKAKPMPVPPPDYMDGVELGMVTPPTELDFSRLSETKIAKKEQERLEGSGASLVNYAFEEPTYENEGMISPEEPLDDETPHRMEVIAKAITDPICVESVPEGMNNIEKADILLDEAVFLLEHPFMGEGKPLDKIVYARQKIINARGLLEDIKIVPNRADGPKCPRCRVATVWINARQDRICPNCGKYPDDPIPVNPCGCETPDIDAFGVCHSCGYEPPDRESKKEGE